MIGDLLVFLTNFVMNTIGAMGYFGVSVLWVRHHLKHRNMGDKIISVNQ